MSKVRRAGGRASRLETALGYHFSDPTLLERALAHRSFVNEQGGDPEDSYERLEFLGDALLGFLVSHMLWQADPLATEGTLSRRKQAVVRTETLARVAGALRLGDALRLGRGELRTGGRDKASLLADVFEALLGAVYVDGGIRAARSFVRRHLGEPIRWLHETDEHLEDYKTRLQESIQARLRQTPSYRIVARSGPAHAPEFEAVALLGRRKLGVGRGSSRKQAEQEAAREALRRFEESDD